MSVRLTKAAGLIVYNPTTFTAEIQECDVRLLFAIDVNEKPRLYGAYTAINQRSYDLDLRDIPRLWPGEDVFEEARREFDERKGGEFGTCTI